MFDFKKNFFSIQSMSILLLIAQATSLVILMRYSRVRKTKHLYATTTVVFSMEIMKFFASLFLIFMEKNWNLPLFLQELYYEIFENYVEMLKVAVPSILFTVQTNLLYVGISRLDVVTYQAVSQMKILTTAFFSVAMLNKSLSLAQWISCVILCIGVTLTQVSNFNTSTKSPSSNSAAMDFGFSSTMIGILSILCATITSGFSSVYFEKMLKNSQASLWVRNLQMSFFSIIFAAIGMYLSSEWDQIVQNGSIFYGYDGIVLTMVSLQALGGLLVAVVMKYTDNIVKGFANAISIGLSWFICVLYFDYELSIHGLMGLILIMIAVTAYSAYPPTSVKVRNIEQGESISSALK